MRKVEILLGAVLCCVFAASLPLIHGQIQGRNTIPDMVQACYLNNTAYNRFTRLPMHINNLISIIRKIEQKTSGQWDMRRITRVLVHRFMFDGIEFSPIAKPDFQFVQKPEEAAKSLMIKQLIPIPPEDILPDYLLDNDEKCALHWMMSHSMNATVRDEELQNPYNPGYSYGSNNPNNQGGNYNPNNQGGNYNPNNQGGSYNPNNQGGGYNPNNQGGSYNPNNPGYNSGGSNYGNNYNRGKRDVGVVSGDNDEKNWDSVSSENTDYNSNDESVVRKDYDEKSKVASGEDSQPSDPQAVKSDDQLSDLEHDVDEVDIFSDSGKSEGSKKSARQVSPINQRKTRRPIETGVVYTKWGEVSVGRLISGIAAGLEPVTMATNGVTYNPPVNPGGLNPWSGGSGFGSGNGNPWGSNSGSGSGYGTPFKSTGGGQQPPYNNQNPYPQPGGYNPNQGSQYGNNKSPPSRWKRQVPSLQPLENLFAATISGDVGQGAIINSPKEVKNYAPPKGTFNDTICPREYSLEPHYDSTKEVYMDSAAWTYMTEAEIRGGLDGFILGSRIRQWDPSATLRLSEILDGYYSEDGVAMEPAFRSCDRSGLLGQVDSSRWQEQAKSFAYIYGNRTSRLNEQQLISRPNLLDELVGDAYHRMTQVASSFSGTTPCTKPGAGNDNSNDNQKLVTSKLTIYGVLDHSSTFNELVDQKRFLGSLVHEIDVSPTGSRLGVVDGNSGMVLINPNWTDISSVLSCAIMGLPTQLKNQDYTRVLTSLRSEIEKVKNEELRRNFTLDNSIVILFLVQGRKLEENQRNEIIRLRNEITKLYGDVSVMATSNKYSNSDFSGIEFIRTPTGGNFSDFAGDFAKELLKRTQGALRYPQCDPELYNQDYEHTIGTDLFLDSGKIEFFKIAPDYFHKGRNVILRFTSDNGKVRVCQSRQVANPSSANAGSNGVTCLVTSGTYVPPGSSKQDVEFQYQKPCGKSGKREDCQPIYISMTSVTNRIPGQDGLDCSVEGCQGSNQVKVTFTHHGMRCGAAGLFSSTFAILITLVAMMNWLRT